jgi:multiple sugar transport system substrate-binding protein
MVAVSAARRTEADAARPIDRRRPIAIYQQLKTMLLEEIVAGRYATGEQLPTEHDLCAQHGISRAPVHRALFELAEEGVILRHRRRGSYINPHWLSTNTSSPELRLIVPEGPWEAMLRATAGDEIRLNVAVADLEDLHQVLVRAVAEGRGPDVAVIDSVRVREFATAGFLQPIDELAPRWTESEYRADFLEPFVTGNSLDGSLVAVQAEADVAGMWFQRQLLADAGLDVPRTWADFAAVARAVADRGVDAPIVMPGGSRAGEATSYCLLALLATNGVAVIDDGAVTLDGVGALEGMSFLRTLVDEGLVAAEVASYDADRPIRQLAHGQAAFCIGGSYEAPALQQAAAISAAAVARQFGFAPLPAGPRGGFATLAGGMVYAVFRQATSPQLAMRLIERAVAPSALMEMSIATGQLPARRSAIAVVGSRSSFLGDTAALLERATVRPSTPSYPRVSAQLQAMLESVLVGRLEPAAAVRRTAEVIAAITGLPLAEFDSDG